MKYKDIKAGETYNMRVKVISVDAEAKGTEVATIFVDENGKELKNSWVYYSRSIASVFSPITPETGTKNTESAPKYDPCRLFKKGDKVRVVTYKGRNKTGVSAGEIGLIDKDEKGADITVEVIFYGDDLWEVDPAYLELVTPAEEIEPFYVCENTESKSFEVRRKKDHKVQAAFYYFNKDDAHAKSEAAKATLEHCDRLNAEHRKEAQQ